LITIMNCFAVQVLLLFCVTVLASTGSAADKSHPSPRMLYSVANCSNPVFNGFYICRSVGTCQHSEGHTSLESVHKYINGSVQKVWYLKDESGGASYGAVETSASAPWTTKPWRKIKGPVEPFLLVQSLDVNVCRRDTMSKADPKPLDSSALIHRLWLAMSSLPQTAANTPESFSFLDEHTSACADVLLSAVIDELERGVQPRVEVVAVLCDWIHLSFGWGIHSVTCFRSMLAFDSPSLAGSEASSHARAGLLASLVEAQQFRPSRVNLAQIDRYVVFAKVPVDSSSAVIDNNGASCAVALPVDLHMTHMACLAHGVGGNTSFSDATSCCLRGYSLLQYALGLIRFEMRAKDALALVQRVKMLSASPDASSQRSNGYIRCVELTLEFLSGSFTAYRQLKSEFQNMQCFSTCQSLAVSSTVTSSPPFTHADTSQSMAADSLRLACFFLNNADPHGSTDDLISMTNSLLAIGAIVTASDLGRAVFLDYLQKPVNLETVNTVTSSFIAEDATNDGRLEALSRLSCVLSAIPHSNTSCREDLDFRIASREWSAIRSSPQLLSFYVSLTLQVHVTEMLSTRNEAVQAKRLVAREMLWLAEMCEATQDCVTQLDLLVPAVRGLFLIAYQGEEYFPMEPVDFDWSIPHSYYRILTSSRALKVAEDSYLTSPTATVDRREGPIRVAFLSAYFFRHSVGRLMGNMILSLDRKAFHVTIVNARKSRSDSPHKVDDLTEKLRARAELWVDLSFSFANDVQTISSLQSDVLVFGDLLMDAFTSHLVSQRLATLQVGFWGHPFSAASTTVDYFISSDGFQEPWSSVKRKLEVTTDFYEQIVLMDSFSANVLADKVFDEGMGMDEVFVKHHDLGSREAYLEYVVSHGYDLFSRTFSHGWRNGTVQDTEPLHVYTCLQSVMKMHPLFDEVLVGLLLRDPNALIVLLSSAKSKFISHLKLQKRLLRALLKGGADATRIVFMPQISSTVYSQIVCGADVTLDSVPFGGGVTLSDSIRCNVPFVTSGPLQRVHRLGHGMAMQLQLPRMTAQDVTTYVQRAAALAEEVSACRLLMRDVHGSYSTCAPAEDPHILSACGVRTALCERKKLLYRTGDVDYGGHSAERNDVTEEWEAFLKRIIRSVQM